MLVLLLIYLIITLNLLDRYHGGTISILLKRGILVVTGGIIFLQFFNEGVAQYPITFPMDKNYLLVLASKVSFHRVIEHFQLILQDSRVIHSGCCIQQLVDM